MTAPNDPNQRTPEQSAPAPQEAPAVDQAVQNPDAVDRAQAAPAQERPAGEQPQA